MFKEIDTYIDNLENEKIDKDRIQILVRLSNFISSQIKELGYCKLNFICTHNSRRSQISQIWAHVASTYYKLPVFSYSGGVEVTAFNIRAVHALQRAGFHIESNGNVNPTYLLSYSNDQYPVVAFSKIFDSGFNPSKDFGAVMTCSQADENCPFIAGANIRLPLRYEDPKVSDDTEAEKSIYNERVKQIALEIFYAFRKASELLKR